jgi:hypothetical protein
MSPVLWCLYHCLLPPWTPPRNGRPWSSVFGSTRKGATHDLVLAAATSPLHDGPGDMELRHWSEAGLLNPSWLRTGKLVTVHESLIVRELGRIISDDWNNAEEHLGVVLAH